MKTMLKETQKDTRFVLAWSSNQSFGRGFQILTKTAYDDGYKCYHYGDWVVGAPEKEWRLDELSLNFEKLEKTYRPTAWERFRSRVFRKPYPKTVDNRPNDNTVVVAKYMNGRHYEVVEYGKRHWTTEFSFPVKPDSFAYIPDEIMAIGGEKKN